MVRKLKPVDDTPIPGIATARRIDSVWIPGRVRNRFWEDRTHRRDYLVWVAGRRHFRVMTDFYRLELSPVWDRYYGRGLVQYWRSSALTALRDCFPNYDWKPWLFPMVPQGFWDVQANRRDYLDWLGKELGFRRPGDWQRISSRDFRKLRGHTLVRRYSSMYELMREYLPELDWDRLDPHRPLSIENILTWADAHHAQFGKWPNSLSGSIAGAGETWRAVDRSLMQGLRGLHGASSLAKLLKRRRAVPVGKAPPKLSEKQILVWADAYFAEKGKWPIVLAGAVAGTSETWRNIQGALVYGKRGLRGNSSLAQLLAKRRGVENRMRLPPLTTKRILAWANEYFAANRKQPSHLSGPIAGTRENWRAIDDALRQGNRGLPGGSSLARLFRKHGYKKQGVERSATPCRGRTPS